MIYRSFLRPILFRLPPETAHKLAVSSVSIFKAAPIRNLFARRYESSQFGKLKRFGLEFANPVGLAAGFDKNGTAAYALAALGFGFIEVGTVTHERQSGNEKPRLFRLPADCALINRLGFNNSGASQVVKNLSRYQPECVIGVNIGKSRSVAIEDAIGDYLASFEIVYDTADYIAINVSSPNTPQLRELQRRDLLTELLTALQQRNHELAQTRSQTRRPLLVKIAPDLTAAELESIIEVAQQAEVAGIIATNTTIERKGLLTPLDQVRACGEGGLSGAPLRARSNDLISFIYQTTEGRLPIIGVGGVFTADDAWQKICAGASLVQLYTGFVYEGPRVAKRINAGLSKILKREGFNSLDDAIGCAVR